MPAVDEHQEFESDLKALEGKYLTVRRDIEDVRNLIRDGAWWGDRCREFYPDFVFRVEISISALGPLGKERCTLVFERLDRNLSYFLLVFDNDSNRWNQQIIDKIKLRKDDVS